LHGRQRSPRRALKKSAPPQRGRRPKKNGGTRAGARKYNSCQMNSEALHDVALRAGAERDAEGAFRHVVNGYNQQHAALELRRCPASIVTSIERAPNGSI
jgi:hypothetical protein